MKRAITMIGGLIFLSVSGFAVWTFVRSPDDRQSEDVPRVEAWLREPVDKIQGHTWFRFPANGKSSDLSAIEEPCRITVHFPSGRRYTTWSRTVVFSMEDGRLEHVQLIPLSKRVSYEEALATVEGVARELGVENDKNYNRDVPKWKNDLPAGNKLGYGIGAVVEDDGEVFFKIKHDNDGWYVVLTLSCPSLLKFPKREKEERKGDAAVK